MKRTIDQFVVGFALFSMFFGAGNIIFPPYLGLGSGPEWLMGFICYYIADIGLAILAIFALLRVGGDINALTDRMGRIPGEIMVAVIVLCIGPFIALPRTGSTVHEMFVTPVFGDVPVIVSIVIFFGITLALTLKESAVVDIIGKFLTPLLFIGLLVLIIMGIVSPIGEVSEQAMMQNVALEGINAGYQTMDVLAALVFGIIIVKSVEDKGYTDIKEKFTTAKNASLVAAVGLLIVYCGLTYLGATVSGILNMRIGRAELITKITYGLLGDAGIIILGVVVTLACVTTAIALVTCTADYFCTLSKGKLSYKLLAVIATVMSAALATVGTEKIIILASPLLSFFYPGALTLIVLSLFGDNIKDFTLRWAVAGSLVGSICTLLYGYGVPLNFVPHLPLSSMGLEWILFAVVFGLVGMIIGKVRKDK